MVVAKVINDRYAIVLSLAERSHSSLLASTTSKAELRSHAGDNRPDLNAQ